MPTRTAATGAGETLRFLVVEDDATSRMILVRMLAKAGYEVVSARNGEEAVGCFRAEQPDMILMDVQMPVMDGWEVTRRVKELSGDRFVPVIFLTASHDSEQLARCVECGGDDFLTKPYNPIILRAKIAALGRIRALHAETTVQRDEIHRHQARLIHEQEMAEAVFQRMTQRGGSELAGVEKLISPASIFNGDLVLSAATPFGSARVLMGDFTGHGLSAAMGAFPVCDAFYAMTANVAATQLSVSRDPLHWECALRLEADTLRRVDPTPLLMQMLIDLQGLRPHRQNLYLVLSELYTNALDHGLLELDSAMKESAAGFGEYYALRDKRLAEIQHGWIQLTMRHERCGQGGCLVIAVEDNGGGFDVEETIAPLAANEGHSGRGIALVRTLCQQLSYTDGGRRATAVYAWSGSP